MLALAPCEFVRLVLAVLALADTSAAADTEIHRCLLADGTVAFQETPCAEPAGNPGKENLGKTSDARERRDADDPPAGDDLFTSPFDEPEAPEMPAEPSQPAPVSQDRAECEKTTRDAIDAIDLELARDTGSKEKNQAYLAELLKLTAQLRDCKQL